MTQISSPNKEPERQTGVLALFPLNNADIHPDAWADWLKLIALAPGAQEPLDFAIAEFLCLWGRSTLLAIRTEYLKLGFRADR